MKRYLSLGAIVLSCLTPSCSDDDADGGGHSCGKVAACGGDITGEWTAVDSCISYEGGIATFCPEATVEASGIDISAVVSYKADKTYTSDVTTSGTITLTLPVKCLTQNGVTVTCEQLNESTKGSETELNCTNAAGGGCSCTGTMKSTTTTQTGTYATNGNTLSSTHDGLTEETSYCVSGGEMHYLSKPNMAGSGISGDIVFGKK